MVAIAEAAFRSAWLEVWHGPREMITVNLGAEPVRVGGDARQCTVWARGAAPVALRFWVRDGRVVCGVSLTPGAFIWTAETGRVDIAGSGGVPFQAQANAISGDGQTVVGAFPVGNGWSAFRYRGPGTYEALDLSFGGRTDCQARGVSGDGSVIVGHLTFNNLVRAFRWTVTEGLDILADTFSHARAITHDGLTIAGHAEQPGQSFTTCLWDASGTLQPLDLGEPRAAIFGMTDDAEVFVGEEVIPPPFSASLAIRWSQARGYEQLTDYSHVAHAYDLSADGSVVIGTQEDVPGVARACLWTSAQDLHYIIPDRLHTSVASEVSAGKNCGLPVAASY